MGMFKLEHSSTEQPFARRQILYNRKVKVKVKVKGKEEEDAGSEGTSGRIRGACRGRQCPCCCGACDQAGCQGVFECFAVLSVCWCVLLSHFLLWRQVRRLVFRTCMVSRG